MKMTSEQKELVLTRLRYPIYLSCNLLVLFLEGYAFYILWKIQFEDYERFYLWYSVLLHLAASSCFFLFPYILPKSKRARAKFYVHFCGWFTLFIPVIGPLGAIVTFLSVEKLLKSGGLVADYHDSTSHSLLGAGIPDYVIGDFSQALSNELNVEPIVDILSSDNDNLKRGAISFLSKSKSPQSVSLLKKCLGDMSPEVRFYAHSAITKIDREFVSEIKNIQNSVENGIMNNEEKKIALKQLGDLFWKYSQSNLLEEETQEHYNNLAKKVFKEVLKMDSEDSDSIVMMGNCYLSSKEFDKSEQYFTSAIKYNPHSIKPLLGLCEIYYNKYDFKSLASVVKKMSKIEKPVTGNTSADILYLFWTRSFAER